jgi:asparagine synthase (glutamine-hydrolysing)
MCGIAGFIKREGTPEQALLQVMAERLTHRGPDDAGVHIQDNVGLAHTRLSIIDLGGGHQPLLDADKRLALVANGEIYNYIELREELIARGRSFLTKSDSETILQAYAAYGESFIDKLNGMFAFALYDSEHQKLILARDRLGIKPLFYVELPDRIAFASEIKALLPLLPGPPEIDAAALVQFLQNQFNSGEQAIVQGIRRVLPGQMLSINSALRIEHRQYWSAVDTEPRTLCFEEASREFDELIEIVMREHMRSDVPYGLFLSGGVDSAVLCAMLDRFQDKPVRSFSVGYAGVKMPDELDDAARIAGLFHTEHTALELNRSETFARLPYTVWAADDLMRDYANLPTAALSQTAAKELKVVLSGEGGDEVFAGYRRYRPPWIESTLKRISSPGSGGFRTRGQLRSHWSQRLFGPSLQNARDAVRRPFIEAWRATPTSWSDLQRRQYTDIVTALPDNLLVKADRMMMAFSLEGRVPYLDHRIVEFGLSLPDDLKVTRGAGKLFLKRWAEQFLPRDHLYLKKRGFHVPVGEWLRGEVLDRLGNKLPRNEAIREWFDPDAVGAIIRHHRSGRSFSREIWSLMQFAIWHYLFIEHLGKRPSPEEDPLDWIS